MSDINKSAVPQQEIILDTCILTYLTNKSLSLPLISYLEDLVGRGFSFAISEISIYELLSGATQKQEQEGISILENFTRYFVDATVLQSASRLSTLYAQQAKSENRTLPEASIADKIIAATTILTGSLVFTADINDFPRPIFTEQEEKLITYKSKSRKKMLVIQLLKPNLEVINQRFNERT